ncbi:hypothetical protein ACHAXA_001041 [Cyclostephanos tholiformis]|uniref:Uncharacterized protein n=1 Tax=Cyclostephanos tholiformis TaxID=382380 RepID=A0ABD3RW57_9STRA
MILRRLGRASGITRRELPSNHDAVADEPLFEDSCNDDNDSPTNTLAIQFPQPRKKFNLESRSYLYREIIVGGALFIGTTISTFITILQLHAHVVEYQGPLDHVASVFRGPFYGLSCPDFSIDNTKISTGDESEKYNSTASLLWDCNGINQNISEEKVLSVSFPRIFMIGARDDDEDTFRAWNLDLHRMTSNHSRDGDSDTSRRLPHFKRINTLQISNQYALSGGAPLWKSTVIIDDNHFPNSTSIAKVTKGFSNTLQKESDGRKYLCRKIKWEHRLFAVYQSVFADLLSTYPKDSGFVIVEDDAVLNNPDYFKQEVCNAQYNRLDFYSLYRSPLQRTVWTSPSWSCIYVHGTVAFYIRRSIMEKIVNERRRAYFCRFPIDMYISKLGLWFSTRREIVSHSDAGRVGSTT